MPHSISFSRPNTIPRGTQIIPPRLWTDFNLRQVYHTVNNIQGLVINAMIDISGIESDRWIFALNYRFHFADRGMSVFNVACRCFIKLHNQ